MSTIREQITNEAGPANTRLADRAKIVALGHEAVPVLIDVFLNPATPYGDINQATVADALIEFSKQGNKEADAFIRRIALGEVRLTAGWGGAAREIVQQHFAWIGVDPAMRGAHSESQTTSAKVKCDFCDKIISLAKMQVICATSVVAAANRGYMPKNFPNAENFDTETLTDIWQMCVEDRVTDWRICTDCFTDLQSFPATASLFGST